MDNLIVIASYASITLCAFLGFHFLTLENNNRKANQLLASFLLYTGLSILAPVLDFLNVFSQFPFWAYLLELFASFFLFGPLLLYYALALTGNWSKKARKFRWMFVPFFIEVVLLSFHYSGVFYVELTAKILEVYRLLAFPFTFYVFYMLLKMIKEHNQNILHLFSFIEDKQINWLRNLTVVNMVFLVFWLIDDGLALVIGENNLSNGIAVSSIFATLLNVVWMGNAGLKQQYITPIIKEESTEPLSLNHEDKVVFDRVKKEMETGTYYKNSDLSLGELAESLALNPKELSRIINQQYGNNFYHFVNTYRIRHFKALCEDEEKNYMGIMGLANEAGFKSKSTFYTFFKKVEGVTPKEFESRFNRKK